MRISFAERFGPWALVTGAANGLGAEFAHQCAAAGLHLVLLDCDTPALHALAARLRLVHGIQIKPVSIDLGRQDLLDVLAEALGGIEVGLLINNAAKGGITPFFTASLTEQLSAVDVNVRAPLLLSHHFGRRMIDRGRGGIIFLSSASALQGTALAASYAGTKAFNLILAEGLWYEAARHGVDVLGLMPGPTQTAGFAQSAPRLAGSGARLMDPEAVVAEALDALGRQPSVVSGRMNRFAMQLMSRVLPRATAIRLISRTMERMYPGRLTP